MVVLGRGDGNAARMASVKSWKAVVASWPESLRDLWGDLADRIEGDRVSARTAEGIAFVLLLSIFPALELEPVVIHPVVLSYPWRQEVATWSDERRRQWGELANAAAKRGLEFPADEQAAFEEIRAAGVSRPQKSTLCHTQGRLIA